MLQLSLSTSLMPPTAPGAGPNPASSGAFALALADALNPIEAPTVAGGTIVPAGDPRQAAADAGKNLPGDAAASADVADPALAWLAFAAPAAAPITETQNPSPATPTPSDVPAPVTGTADIVLPKTGDQDAPGKQPVEGIATPIVATTNPSPPAPTTTPGHPAISGGPAQPQKIVARNAVPDGAAIIVSAGPTSALTPTDAMPVAGLSHRFTRSKSSEGHDSRIQNRHGRSASRHKAIDADDVIAASGAAAIVVPAAPPIIKTPDGTKAPSITGVAPTPVNPALPSRPNPAGAPSGVAEAAAVAAAQPASITTGQPSTAAESQAPTASKAFSLLNRKGDGAIDPPLSDRTAPAARAISAAAPAGSAVMVANAPAGTTVPSITPSGVPTVAPQTVIVSPAPTADHSTAITPTGERLIVRAAVAASPAPPVQLAAPAPAVPAPQAATPAPAQPAGVVFGIALNTAVAANQRPAADDKTSPRDAALQALIAAAGSAQPLAMVAAAGGAQHGALDMRRDDWPQAMIDRIEALRDAADANNTSIRLVPDALGKVDVSIRHDGDAVHVHFAAETPQTRQLLADAQPRLADAAQARGLRLAQTSVDAGSTGAGAQQQQQQGSAMPRPSSSIRPVQMPAAVAHDGAAAPDSTRLA